MKNLLIIAAIVAVAGCKAPVDAVDSMRDGIYCARCKQYEPVGEEKRLNHWFHQEFWIPLDNIRVTIDLKDAHLSDFLGSLNTQIKTALPDFKPLVMTSEEPSESASCALQDVYASDVFELICRAYRVKLAPDPLAHKTNWNVVDITSAEQPFAGDILKAAPEK